MRVINARNVNDAYVQGLELLFKEGVEEDTRAGVCRVMPCPVTTVYDNPRERVLWSPERNANPFFHLGESLWMLNGLREATWLDQFVGNFSSRFAEENGLQHGAYGYRWRAHFRLLDQLDEVVRLLKNNSSDRRIVISMWDPLVDLGVDKRDVPCNTQAYVRIRKTRENRIGNWVNVKLLDLTVCCRSNDLVWGAYGANAVHFSMLQEYLAARVGVEVGKYYQISNNFHGYTATTPSEWSSKPIDLYAVGAIQPSDWLTHPDEIDDDLDVFFSAWDLDGGDPDEAPHMHNQWLMQTAWPLLKLYAHRKTLTVRDLVVYNRTHYTDWDLAGTQWLGRFIKKREDSNAGRPNG